MGCAAAGVAGWKENILSYPADWDKDGKLEDWQGVRAYYPNIVHEMNTKNNFLLFHEIGHLTRLGDCVFPEIASISVEILGHRTKTFKTMETIKLDQLLMTMLGYVKIIP